MKQFSWAQKFEFSMLSEPISLGEISLAWLLLQAHVQSANVQIFIALSQYRFDIKIENGAIVSLIGVPGLLSSLGVDMTAHMTLEELIGHAMAKGSSYEEVINAVVDKLGLRLIGVDQHGKGKVGISDKEFGMSVSLQKNTPSILIKGIEASDEELLRIYSPKMRDKVLKAKVNCKPSQLSLPSDLLRFFRDIQSGKRLGELVTNPTRVTNDWHKLHILTSFSLISFQKKEVKQNTEAIEKYKDLKQKLREMKEQEPHVLFGLTERSDVGDEVIDKKLRQLSMEYHPDRFIGEDSQVVGVIEEIYTFINEVYSSMKDEEYREQLKDRLMVEKRGEKYVSLEDKQKTEVLYEQAKFLFNKRKWDDACDLLDKAFDINPYNWRLNVLRIRTYVILKKKDLAEAGEEILSFTDAKGHDRVELLFQAGEYFYQADEKIKAKQIFKQIVDLEEDHQRAKHFLLRMEREAVTQKEEQKATGFWGKLFGKK